MDIKTTGSFTNSAAPGGVLERTAAGMRETGKAEATAVAETSGAQARTNEAPNEQELAGAIDSINTALQSRTSSLEFSVDSDTGRAVVKVIDKDTQEVIRQMPSREAMEIAKMIDNMQGLLQKQTV